jgi:hypothetical protein
MFAIHTALAMAAKPTAVINCVVTSFILLRWQGVAGMAVQSAMVVQLEMVVKVVKMVMVLTYVKTVRVANVHEGGEEW